MTNTQKTKLDNQLDNLLVGRKFRISDGDEQAPFRVTEILEDGHILAMGLYLFDTDGTDISGDCAGSVYEFLGEEVLRALRSEGIWFGQKA